MDALLCAFLLMGVLMTAEAFVGLMRAGRLKQPSTATRPTISMKLAHKKARKQNVPGNLFVDESCIDCDVCRWMCPSVFKRMGIKSAVYHQPKTKEERLASLAAMVSCPVGSIRTNQPDPLAKQALEVLPSEISADRLPGVLHLGYHSVDSYGATPYLILGAAATATTANATTVGSAGETRGSVGGFGNVMVDCPRYNSRLASRIEALGGVDVILLTHKDDVADHKRWQARFPNSQRIIHRTDVTKDTESCEVMLEGEGTWYPSPFMTIVHTPGHTAGCLSLLVRTRHSQSLAAVEERIMHPSPPRVGTESTSLRQKQKQEQEERFGDVVLFSGDHIGFSARKGRLDGFKQYNKGNIEVQAMSMRMLADPEFNFTWLLPGHGRMTRFSTIEEKNESMRSAAEAFLQEDPSQGAFSVGY